nr:adult cement protein 5 [Chelonibia testudinaria]
MTSAVRWASLLALLAVPATSVFVDQGFLLTTPKVLVAGTTEQFCISFFNIRNRRVFMQVGLLPKKNSTNSESVANTYKTYKVTGRFGMGSKCFDLDVPKKARPGTMYIRATVRAPGFYSTKTSEIRVLGYTLVTLVQTDKSKYKAGQSVRFRVVTLNSDLTAQEEVVKQIFITTPANTRLAQWDNVQTRSGIIQEKFLLTEEPPLGMWTIHVRRGDRITRQTFEVAEFVLPRFEVTVTGPKFIIRHANTVTLKVCAKYTFGKPVTSADVSLFVARRVPTYFYRRNRFGTPDRRANAPSNITLEDVTDSKGCSEFDIILSKIGVDKKTERELSIFVSQIEVKATVTESGTDLEQMDEKNIPIQTPRLSIQFDSQAGTEFLKPSLEYVGYATVKGADGNPMAGETLKVCHTDRYRDQGKIEPIINSTVILHPSAFKRSSGSVKLSNRLFSKLPIIHKPVKTMSKTGACREYNSDKNGRIRFTIPKQPPGILSVNVNIRAKRTGISSSSASKQLRAWFSLSNSFISIMPVTDPFGLKCSGIFKVKVATTVRQSGGITFLVMARGQIVDHGLTDRSGYVTVRLGFNVSPTFKLLVYYVNSLGEVVSDSRAFDVEKCFQNQVSVAWNKKQVEPGEQATLEIRGAPYSLCGVSALDRSVELLSDKNKLTAENIFQKLQQFVIGKFSSPSLTGNTQEYCKRKPRYARPSYFGFGGFHPEVDMTHEMEAMEGDVAPISARVGIIPPRPILVPSSIYYSVVQDDSIKAFDVAGYLPLTNLVLESRPCEKNERSYRIYGPPRFFGGGARGPVLMAAAAPSDFAVSNAVLKSSVPEVAEGASAAATRLETAVRSFFPETFLFQLQGLGASGSASVTRKMPDTITSWVGSAFCSGLKSGFGLSKSASITTFKPFFAQLAVPFSVKRGEVLRLKISVFNFLSADLSVSVSLSPSSDFSVQSGASSQQVCVRASKPSVVEFPLEFSSLGKVDITAKVVTSGSACGSYNTVSASDALRRSLEVKPEGFPQEEVNTAFLCKQDNPSVAIGETFELAKPSNLVPDSQRAWVNIVGDLIAPSAENLERLVRVPTGCGEQNMIGFVPNILVRRYLSEVKLLTDSLKDRTTANMVTGYQRELRYRRRDGSYSAFPERSPSRYTGSLWLTAYVVRSYVAASRYIAIDTKDLSISTRWIVSRQEENGSFKPYGTLFHKEMRGGVANGADEAMTAFVTLALLEAGDQKAAVSKAVAFLSAATTFSTLYAEILVAHALVQAGKTTEGADRVAKILAKGIRRGGQLHWAGDRNSKVGGSRSVDVEMTAYMVLTLLKLGGSKNFGEAALAIKWVNSQRNSGGGFVSTQDTVVAMTALAEFAIKTYSPTMAVEVSATASQGFRYDVSITAANRLLTRQQRLPRPLKLPNTAIFRVTGEGCAVVQSVFRYNTKVPFPDPSFNLKAEITKTKKSCSFTLRVCTSFKEPNKESNMAIVEIEMLSGFLSVDSSLRKLENDKVVERWEYKEGKASLYFNGFTTKEVCFDVRFVRAIEVEKLKPAVVRVYDYYAHEDRFEVEYGPPTCS